MKKFLALCLALVMVFGLVSVPKATAADGNYIQQMRIEGNSHEMHSGETMQLNVTVTDPIIPEGCDLEPDQFYSNMVSWASSDPALATVSADYTQSMLGFVATVTAKEGAEGTVVIKAYVGENIDDPSALAKYTINIVKTECFYLVGTMTDPAWEPNARYRFTQNAAGGNYWLRDVVLTPGVQCKVFYLGADGQKYWKDPTSNTVGGRENGNVVITEAGHYVFFAGGAEHDANNTFFGAMEHLLTVQQPANGTVSVSPNYTYANAGTTFTVSATANAGYALDSVIVKNTDDETVYATLNNGDTFNMPDYPVTVTAVFSVDPAAAVAQLGDDLYLTFAAAAAARTSDDDVITLLANAGAYTMTSAAEKVKVAKNGKTITVNAPEGPYAVHSDVETISGVEITTYSAIDAIYEITKENGEVSYSVSGNVLHHIFGDWTIKLLKNHAPNAYQTVGANIGALMNHTVTLDLADHTMTLRNSEQNYCMRVFGNNTLILKNGVFRMAPTGTNVKKGILLDAGCTLIVEDTVTLTTTNSIPAVAAPDGSYRLKITEEANRTIYTVVPLYSIEVDDEIEHGSVEADKDEAEPGETVALTVIADQGYAIGQVKYNDTAIAPVNGEYSFAMPAEDVTVTATFTSNQREAYAVSVIDDENDTATLTFYYDTMKATHVGEGVAVYSNIDATDWNNTLNDPVWKDVRSEISEIIFDGSFADARPTSTANWFAEFRSLITVTGIENLNTSSVTSMSHMFDGCSALKTVDVSGFKTGNVRLMAAMFQRCIKLTSLGDISGWDVRNVTNMNNMFYKCWVLPSLDISGWNTSSVITLSFMFADCFKIQTITVGSGWTVANVTDADTSHSSVHMFKDCRELVGGAGTVYDAEHQDKAYAHIDGGESNPGYFNGTAAPQNEYDAFVGTLGGRFGDIQVIRYTFLVKDTFEDPTFALTVGGESRPQVTDEVSFYTSKWACWWLHDGPTASTTYEGYTQYVIWVKLFAKQYNTKTAFTITSDGELLKIKSFERLANGIVGTVDTSVSYSMVDLAGLYAILRPNGEAWAALKVAMADFADKLNVVADTGN